MHVSHETIYSWVYAQPRNHLKRLLVSQLRQGKPKWAQSQRFELLGNSGSGSPDDPSATGRNRRPAVRAVLGEMNNRLTVPMSGYEAIFRWRGLEPNEKPT